MGLQAPYSIPRRHYPRRGEAIQCSVSNNVFVQWNAVRTDWPVCLEQDKGAVGLVAAPRASLADGSANGWMLSHFAVDEVWTKAVFFTALLGSGRGESSPPLRGRRSGLLASVEALGSGTVAAFAGMFVSCWQEPSHPVSPSSGRLRYHSLESSGCVSGPPDDLGARCSTPLARRPGPTPRS